MRKLQIAVFPVFLGFGLLCSLPAHPDPPVERVVQFDLVVRNSGRVAIKEGSLVALLPVHSRSQSSAETSCSTDFSLESDSLGNRVLRIRLFDLAPFSTRIIRVRNTVAFGASAASLDGVAPEGFLDPAPYIESKAPEILEISAQCVSESASESVRSCYDWVRSHIAYAGYISNPRGAAYAARERTGDCTEFATLHVALCRSLGIPSRVVSGYVVETNGILDPLDYHDWCEVWFDGAWRIVDPQRGVFDPSPGSYLAFRIAAEQIAFGVPGFSRFTVAPEGLSVFMAERS